MDLLSPHPYFSRYLIHCQTRHQNLVFHFLLSLNKKRKQLEKEEKGKCRPRCSRILSPTNILTFFSPCFNNLSDFFPSPIYRYITIISRDEDGNTCNYLSLWDKSQNGLSPPFYIFSCDFSLIFGLGEKKEREKKKSGLF